MHEEDNIITGGGRGSHSRRRHLLVCMQWFEGESLVLTQRELADGVSCCRERPTMVCLQPFLVLVIWYVVHYLSFFSMKRVFWVKELGWSGSKLWGLEGLRPVLTIHPMAPYLSRLDLVWLSGSPVKSQAYGCQISESSQDKLVLGTLVWGGYAATETP